MPDLHDFFRKLCRELALLFSLIAVLWLAHLGEKYGLLP
jgi:hypothetical protein